MYPTTNHTLKYLNKIPKIFRWNCIYSFSKFATTLNTREDNINESRGQFPPFINITIYNYYMHFRTRKCNCGMIILLCTGKDTLSKFEQYCHCESCTVLYEVQINFNKWLIWNVIYIYVFKFQTFRSRIHDLSYWRLARYYRGR